jgi:hypothetical protein
MVNTSLKELDSSDLEGTHRIVVLSDMLSDIGLRYNTTLFANNDTPRRIVVKEIFKFHIGRRLYSTILY